MKRILVAVCLLASSTFFGQLKNNSFDLSGSYGDLLMRDYIANDQVWKRAITSSSNEMTFNWGGDFSQGVTVQGSKLKIAKFLEINKAVNSDNNSPGLILSGSRGDDFLYNGERLNHYGIGFHSYKDNTSPVLGNNGYMSSWFGLSFFSQGQNRLRINYDGKVGIGTVNPDEKLTVKGKIHSEEVIVDLSVPADYVFEKYYEGTSELKEDYKMPSLEEVEAFTKKNHHLPSVPSAATIQKEGLQLKEMTNLLLQKIEELTLYTIEQEKRIKALEKKLAEKK